MSIALDMAASLDAVTFARRLGVTPDPWQARALRSTSKRALWNCARQSGKSSTAALLALHRSVYTPGALVIMVSPTQRQSGELYRKFRDYATRLPTVSMTEDTTTSATLANGSRVVSLPGSEATVRGYSAASLAIFDEAARTAGPLYFAVTPMLAVSDGQLIAMSTPFGKQGWWSDAWHGDGDWERVRVTAYDCKRISPEFLAAARAEMGEWWWAQEFMTEFREAEDSVFTHAEIRAALDPSVLPLFPEEPASQPQQRDPAPVSALDDSVRPLFADDAPAIAGRHRDEPGRAARRD